MAIDSTMLAAFRSCPQKMFRQYIEHWKPKTDSVHLIAGGAFATGIEEARRAYYERGADADTAVGIGLGALLRHYGDFECPPDSAKSAERTAGALEFYFDNYPLDNDPAVPLTFADGSRGIEFSFAQPLPIPHPVTGDPLLYTGRSDMLASFAGGNFVFDEKTTSSLGASWGRQWDMRSQFTGYCWAAQQFSIPISGVIVRGVSILKTKYDTQQAITYRSQFEIDRWLHQVCRDIQRMIACWEEGYWDYSLDHACTEYSGCVLTNVCKSADPESWLPIYFDQKVWDPLARRELSIAEYDAGLTGQ
jgi:hypothetical protein